MPKSKSSLSKKRNLSSGGKKNNNKDSKNELATVTANTTNDSDSTSPISAVPTMVDSLSPKFEIDLNNNSNNSLSNDTIINSNTNLSSLTLNKTNENLSSDRSQSSKINNSTTASLSQSSSTLSALAVSVSTPINQSTIGTNTPVDSTFNSTASTTKSRSNSSLSLTSTTNYNNLSTCSSTNTNNVTNKLNTTTTTSSGNNTNNSANNQSLSNNTGATPATPPTQQKSRSKSNDRFHQLFPSVPLEEYVIDTYSCAYVKSLNLYQGVMFLTNNYICFYSKILNHENILILKLAHVNSIVKTMHALIFPTAIRIETKNSTYSFTSFRSRSNTLDHLTELLKQARERQINELSDSEKKSSELTGKDLSDFETPTATLTETGHEKSNGEKNKKTTDDLNLDETTSITRTNSDSNLSLNCHKLANCNHIDCCRKTNHKSKAIANQFLNNHHYSSMSNKNNFYNYHLMNNNNNNSSNNLIYEFDFSNLSKNMVTVSLRHKKSLLQKVKILLGILIPGFFDISRIDALLPICFLIGN